MSYLKLLPNGLNYAIKEYGLLGNLRRIMARNDDNFEKYIGMTNRTLPNQNPLVEFLLMFSVSLEWTPEYLINVIDNKLQQYASANNFTCLYDRGKNFQRLVYPELGHNTLMVVPFGKPTASQIDGYFNNELNTLVPLFPIYTDSHKQYWNVMDLITTNPDRLTVDGFSIVQMDPYALIIGLWRWLRRGVDWGNSPHGYLMNFPIMNLYLYHNELANYNYLNGEVEKLNVITGSFNLEPYYTHLKDYTSFKDRYLQGFQMKSFTNFVAVNQVSNIAVNQSKMIFPDTGKSLFWIQMQWVWTIASLGMVQRYLKYNNYMGTVDGIMTNNLNQYYKAPLQSQLNQIKANKWESHFEMLYNRVKALK